MNRGRVMLCLGLAAGVLAYHAWTAWRATCTAGDLSCRLAWMRDDLHLSEEQFGRVLALHAHSSSRLRQLALDLARMNREFAAFEQTRLSEDRVDFLEFARFVAERREIEAAADQSARSLIAATADVLSPVQRSRYLALVASATPAAPRAP